MCKRVFVMIMVIWPILSCSQQSFFLDSLFTYDLSEIESTSLHERETAIDRLRSDKGISIGMGITNSYQEEIDAGLSTRIYAKANLWNNGLYSNMKETEVLTNSIKIDSLQGIERAIAHNYGIFFDYIIYLFNQERLNNIDSILENNEKVVECFRNLYYNKLINYDELLDIENTSTQYSILKKSLVSYNMLFDEILSDTTLPKLGNNNYWNVNFEGLVEQLFKDSTNQEIIKLQHQNLDLTYENQNAPSLTTSLGYDISRKRPFFTVNFSVNIASRKRPNLKAQKLRVKNNMRILQIEKKKEVLNVQYEYTYMQKQVSNLQSKSKIIKEQLRKHEVRRAVLSLEESIEEQKLQIQLHMINYEITDLKGQLMLQLLKLKKKFTKLKIGPYMELIDDNIQEQKFAGNRYVIIKNTEDLSKLDKLVLKQNEITPISSQGQLNTKESMTLDPSNYETRMEMEKAIIYQINTKNKINFVIADLALFKELELRTLSQKEYTINHLTQ